MIVTIILLNEYYLKSSFFYKPIKNESRNNNIYWHCRGTGLAVVRFLVCYDFTSTQDHLLSLKFLSTSGLKEADQGVN